MNEHDNMVTLDTPIKRGDTLIETVTLIKPNAGTLRGVSLAAVAGSDVDAMIKVLPRMTLPALTEAEITRMELPDMIAIAGKVIGFLTPKSQQGTSPEA
ncbi:phage tail assembly protein [Pectobacterium brasiliense]|uniref:phage tail assembly protein n=1 Tax=Pectobacterium brasiliense TaxID=180957 RepID=UPI0015DF5EFD|nr:phage tail assembly protein [Pectobacterium brasiliense]MBA0216743.1 phage tail assembly protein [Pectobacterium brasiliense]MBN3073346.1 phage tail assembly protein [Pectobacterium brasiliense]MBN3169122.1 phage tail assembly protein [Pectobacterium brasiliense]